MSAYGRPEQGRAKVDVRVGHALCKRRHDLAHRARALQQPMPDGSEGHASLEPHAR